MRSIQNFVSDIKKVKRNRTSPSKDPGWGGSHIFGNSKCVKKVQPSTDILHTFRLKSYSYSSLSICNPNVSPLINRNKVLLSQYIDYNNTKLYSDPSFLFSQVSPYLVIDDNLNKIIDKGINDIMNKTKNCNKKSVGHDQFLLKFLLNKSNQGAVSSIYSHLVKCKFNSSEHHNMKRWKRDPHICRRINPSSNLLRRASSNLVSAKTTAYSHKAS